ncbi:hypothetical protein ACFQPF_15875 [Fictibacillus iocasae]|uniref:Uncharacterized protein n=1 Tax=Fictibacillus iocasae TaxID=2715437 RepID=A0ABW2NYT9_9BACL
MTAMIFMVSAFVSLLMIGCAIRFPYLVRVYSGLAFLSLLTAGSLLSVTILNVMREGEVFMTTVHRVLLSRLFLIGIGYSGLYALVMTGLCFIHPRTGKHPID